MSRRFNNLDAALKFLKPVGAAIDAPVPDAPAGTALKQYQDFKAGKLNITYPSKPDSNPGSIVRVAVQPFALPSASTDRYNAPFTGKGTAALGTFGLSAAILGHTALTLTTIVARGFVPAKAICVNTTGTAATEQTSKITGQKYKAKAAAGRTFPFGAATPVSYSGAKAAILTAVETAGTTRSVSFTPEKF